MIDTRQVGKGASYLSDDFRKSFNIQHLPALNLGNKASYANSTIPLLWGSFSASMACCRSSHRLNVDQAAVRPVLPKPAKSFL